MHLHQAGRVCGQQRVQQGSLCCSHHLGCVAAVGERFQRPAALPASSIMLCAHPLSRSLLQITATRNQDGTQPLSGTVLFSSSPVRPRRLVST